MKEFIAIQAIENEDLAQIMVAQAQIKLNTELNFPSCSISKISFLFCRSERCPQRLACYCLFLINDQNP
jgi:hypothetical protein